MVVGRGTMTQIAKEQARNIMFRIKEALNKEFSENSEYPRFRALTDNERRQWTISSVNTLEKQVINDIIVSEIIQEINHDLLIAHLKKDQLNKQIRKFMRREYARYAKLQEKRLYGSGAGGEERPEPYKEPEKLEEVKKQDIALNINDLRNFIDTHLTELKALEKQNLEDMYATITSKHNLKSLASKHNVSEKHLENQIKNVISGPLQVDGKVGKPKIQP